MTRTPSPHALACGVVLVAVLDEVQDDEPAIDAHHAPALVVRAAAVRLWRSQFLQGSHAALMLQTATAHDADASGCHEPIPACRDREPKRLHVGDVHRLHGLCDLVRDGHEQRRDEQVAGVLLAPQGGFQDAGVQLDEASH